LIGGIPFWHADCWVIGIMPFAHRPKEIAVNRMQKTVLGTALATAMLGLSGVAQARLAAVQEVSFTNAQGRTIPATLFRPTQAGPRPAVVMMPGCAGAVDRTSDAYRTWGERLAAAGYVALLVDSDRPRGGAEGCDRHLEGARERAVDADGAYRFLATSGFVAVDRVGLIGWSQGASGALAALDASRADGTGRFRTALAFNPSCALDNDFGGVAQSTWKPYAPVKILHAATDAQYRDGTCIRRIVRAQQLGATSVSLVTRHGADAGAATPAAWEVAGAEAMDLLENLLKN